MHPQNKSRYVTKMGGMHAEGLGPDRIFVNKKIIVPRIYCPSETPETLYW